MVALIDIPIVGQSYNMKDWALDCQRTVNLYPQVVESGNAPQVAALLCTPGLVKRFEFKNVIRGLFALTDFMLVVAGNALFKVDKNERIKEIGEISGDDLVSFADNSLHIMIVSDNAYRFDIKKESLAKLEITNESGFLGAGDVTFLDSRFVWSIPNSGRMQWSNLLETKTDALSYATAEAKSDNVVRTIANNGQLWLIGERTTEIWNSTGSNDLPFQRMSGAYIPTGCAAKDSVCQFGGALIWLTQTEHGQSQIVMTEGYQVKRISNHAIEADISNYDSVDDAYSFSYQQDGHAFFVITFPSVKKTWCYDASTQMWHERAWYNPSTFMNEHHRANTHCFFNSEHLVGDRENGLIYRLCPDCRDDNKQMILRERTTPVINPHLQKLIFDELEIKMQVGQMDNTKPLVMLDWSDDGGKTWSRVYQQNLGGIGKFSSRVSFRRLGQSLNRVFRLKMSDAANLVILGAKAKVR